MRRAWWTNAGALRINNHRLRLLEADCHRLFREDVATMLEGGKDQLPSHIRYRDIEHDVRGHLLQCRVEVGSDDRV